MNYSDIFFKYENKILASKYRAITETPEIKNWGEVCLYKFISHEIKDAKLLTATELRDAINLCNRNEIETIVLNFGHFFNAEYSDIMSLNHYAHEWFNGNIYSFSPEEILFLAIRADKTIEEVIENLRADGTRKILGFLPISIAKSKYYSDMDELFIEDRHHIFNLCMGKGITFNYPFNIEQVENSDDLKELHQFIVKNDIADVVLQPNPLIDTQNEFDYLDGQLLISQFFQTFQFPSIMKKTVNKFYTNEFFPVLKSPISQ